MCLSFSFVFFKFLVSEAAVYPNKGLYILSAAGFICPSICLSHLLTAAAACGGFAAVGPAGRRCRWTAAAAGRTAARRSAAMRAVSRCQLT